MCSINHEKKAIFIHIPKTAGIYIRSALTKKYGFELYLFERPDHLSYCKTDIKFNQNSNKLYKQFFFGNKIHGIIEYYKTSKYLSDFMGMDDKKWETYYKFCFVRNPYDRIVSGWNYIQQIYKYDIPFEKYLEYKDIVNEDEYFHVFLPQSKHFYNEKNEIFMNYIGKYENLEEDFKKILLTIGFKEEEITHNKNKPLNKLKHSHYTEMIKDQNMLDEINKICSDDLNILGYKKIEYINEIAICNKKDQEKDEENKK